MGVNFGQGCVTSGQSSENRRIGFWSGTYICPEFRKIRDMSLLTRILKFALILFINCLSMPELGSKKGCRKRLCFEKIS
jgi:hypothetical protein